MVWSPLSREHRLRGRAIGPCFWLQRPDSNVTLIVGPSTEPFAEYQLDGTGLNNSAIVHSSHRHGAPWTRSVLLLKHASSAPATTALLLVMIGVTLKWSCMQEMNIMCTSLLLLCDNDDFVKPCRILLLVGYCAILMFQNDFILRNVLFPSLSVAVFIVASDGVP